MPVTLTVKNIPDALYARLKAEAEAHRRSMNSEVIVRLESALLPRRVSAAERLARIDALRGSLGPAVFDPDEIDRLRRADRP